MRRDGLGLTWESTDYTDYTDYFSCQRKLLLTTDNTDNTKISFGQQITLITQIIFLPTKIIFANGEHEEHEVFFIWSTDYTEN